MDKTFRSKSARIPSKNVANLKETITKIEKRYISVPAAGDFIAWIGEDCPDKQIFGFTCVDMTTADVSSVIRSKLLVVNNTHFSSNVNALIQLTYEYGVPALWIGKFLPPQEKIWFFKACSKKLCWELICTLAK